MDAVLEIGSGLAVTHVLSVLNFEFDEHLQKAVANVSHLHLSVVDIPAIEPSSDLLHSFPRTCNFIESALAGRSEGSDNAVLVHCLAGRSRSVTVVAAYFIMSKHLSPDEALNVIRTNLPRAQPNSGFMAQLEMWHEMGCALVRGYEQYE